MHNVTRLFVNPTLVGINITPIESTNHLGYDPEFLILVRVEWDDLKGWLPTISWEAGKKVDPKTASKFSHALMTATGVLKGMHMRVAEKESPAGRKGRAPHVWTIGELEVIGAESENWTRSELGRVLA